MAAAVSNSASPTNLLTARTSKSLALWTERFPLRKSTFGCSHLCAYRCPSNSHKHGGPPPRSPVQGANTGFSYSEYIKHEMYCTAEIARPVVSRDHQAFHKR